MSDFDDSDDEPHVPIAKQEKFFTKFSRGQWKGILSTKVYKQIKEWCDAHDADKEVVFRFLFLDDVKNKPLPIFVMARPLFTSGKIKINCVKLPSEKDLDKKTDSELMSLPEWVKDMSLFCVPKTAFVGLD